MNPEDMWWWAGFTTAGVLYGYFALDGHKAHKITQYNDDYVLQRAADIAVNNSFSELVRTNEVGLPERFMEELRSRPVVIDRYAQNARERYISQFYETSKSLVEQILPTGPISWITKRLTLSKPWEKITKEKLIYYQINFLQ
ncbi:MAG: hypothetical protein ABIB79_05420 [archaeon]